MGLAGAAGWPLACGDEDEDGPAPAPLPAGLRKCLAMDSLNHRGDLEDLAVNGNLRKVLALRTRWVRLWIRWDKAQPHPPDVVPLERLGDDVNTVPGCGAGCGYEYIRGIDHQLALARAAGLNVILTTWHFPRWANGTAGRPLDWAREDRGSADTPVGQLKAMELCVPVGELGEGGHYGRWLDWLMGRYRRHGRAFVLEIMNEPNHQLWPQQAPSAGGDRFGSGEVVMGGYVAEMMETARRVSGRHGHPIHVAGPALSDRAAEDTRAFTKVETIVPRVLDGLRIPATPTFLWTHHNYSDVELELTSPSRAELCRDLLAGRWRGRGGPADPRVWLTEGGARLGSRGVDDLVKQAELVRAAWDRMRAARGIEMFSNYLMYADPVANSGLREDPVEGGDPRPVWDAFRDLPPRVHSVGPDSYRGSSRARAGR